MITPENEEWLAKWAPSLMESTCCVRDPGPAIDKMLEGADDRCISMLLYATNRSAEAQFLFDLYIGAMKATPNDKYWSPHPRNQYDRLIAFIALEAERQLVARGYFGSVGCCDEEEPAPLPFFSRAWRWVKGLFSNWQSIIEAALGVDYQQTFSDLWDEAFPKEKSQ